LSSFKSENKKQLDELRKIEKKIKELQEIEKLEKKPVLITNRILLKFWFFGLLVVFLGYLVFQSLDVLYLILAAYIVSIAMESVIDWFEKFNLGKKFSITITYILLAIFLL
jgi:predicted PurR-regulated permease PerM